MAIVQVEHGGGEETGTDESTSARRSHTIHTPSLITIVRGDLTLLDEGFILCSAIECVDEGLERGGRRTPRRDLISECNAKLPVGRAGRVEGVHRAS